jgi:hypothetical protein
MGMRGKRQDEYLRTRILHIFVVDDAIRPLSCAVDKPRTES